MDRSDPLMKAARRRDPGVQLVLGLAIVIVGVLFMLDNLHIVRAGDYLRYWPVGLIAIGAAQIVQAHTASRVWSGSIWILIGALLLAERVGFLHVQAWAFWPLLLVFVGGRIFWQAFAARAVPQVPPAGPTYSDWSANADGGVRHFASAADGSTVTATAFLGGFERRVTSPAFRRAELTAFMGGGKLDLTQAVPAAGGAVVDVFALMGGVEVIVPDSWNVNVEVTPFLGTCDHAAVQHATAASPQLTVRGFVMMGGVDIKNGR